MKREKESRNFTFGKITNENFNLTKETDIRQKGSPKQDKTEETYTKTHICHSQDRVS